MTWTDDLILLAARGHHAILCVGNVNDAFPKHAHAALSSWSATVQRTFADTFSLTWVFDPVGGFVFADEEQASGFRALVGMDGSQECCGKDPIERARLAIENSAALPTEAWPALQLMLRAFEAAAEKGTRCLAVLPNADALCSSAPAVGQADAWRLALAIANYTMREDMRAAGHLVVMGSPTAAGIDARLRRPDAPIAILTVRKPNEKERFDYLSSMVGLRARLRDATATIENTRHACLKEAAELRQIKTAHAERARRIQTDLVASLKPEMEKILHQEPGKLAESKNGARGTLMKQAIAELSGQKLKRVGGLLGELKDAEERHAEAEASLALVENRPRDIEAELARLQQALKDGDVPNIDLDKETTARLTRLTQGFGFRQLRNLVVELAAIPADDRDKAIVAARQAVLSRSYGHLVDIVEPAYGFEGIGGLDGVKEFLLDVKRAIDAGDLRSVPMGCLLLGPPGTGKTAIAEGFARECGFLFIKLRNTRSMWVGESERQIEEVLGAVRDLSPVVVLRDEVDEEDSGRDAHQGDSGVSARVRRQWMTFLSDPAIRGKVFVVSCTNRPDRLDPALKRSGRTDERIPVLMPDATTREAVFRVMVRRGNFPSKITDYAPFAAMTEGLSGADIEVIVRHGYEFAVRAGGDAITKDSLKAAVRDFVPSASQSDIAKMTLLAIKETSSRRFLPPNLKDITARSNAAMTASQNA